MAAHRSIRRVLDAYGRASHLSAQVENLTVVRLDKTMPLSPQNALVVTVGEARRRKAVTGDELAQARKVLACTRP